MNEAPTQTHVHTQGDKKSSQIILTQIYPCFSDVQYGSIPQRKNWRVATIKDHHEMCK